MNEYHLFLAAWCRLLAFLAAKHTIVCLDVHKHNIIVFYDYN